MKILARFASWWAGLSSFVAVTGGCPCCGGPPCVRGVALLGFVSALFSFVLRPNSPAETTGETPDPLATQNVRATD